MVENNYEELTNELIALSKEINLIDINVSIKDASVKDLMNLLNAVSQARDNLRALKEVME